MSLSRSTHLLRVRAKLQSLYTCSQSLASRPAWTCNQPALVLLSRLRLTQDYRPGPRPGERANAQLKTWRILRKLRCCPWRAGQLTKAIHVLQTRELQTRVIGG